MTVNVSLRAIMQDLHGIVLGGHFTVGPHITDGGASSIYMGIDVQNGDQVAIKVTKRAAEALHGRRIHYEPGAYHLLQHPHIMPVYGYYEMKEHTYLVMPYVPLTLLKIMQDHPNPHLSPALIPQYLRYGIHIARALAHAHQRGVIHRDIKPSNIIIDTSHEPASALLSDFGIALSPDTTRVTRANMLPGTPAFTAPEQVEAAMDKHAHIDGRVDIYGLGCVLYACLAGRAAYNGPTPFAIWHQKARMPAPIYRFNPAVSRDLSDAISLALAPDPNQRYGSATAFALALKPFVSSVVQDQAVTVQL